MAGSEYWPTTTGLACHKECMLIGSFGDQWDPNIKGRVVSRELRSDEEIRSEFEAKGIRGPLKPFRGFLGGVAKDWDMVQDFIRTCPKCELVYTCPDFSGNQHPKQYYLDRIEALFTKCRKEGALLWYAGHGERETGNWMFKDGVITFQEVFDLYKTHFRGKVLVIVSDCCYAGCWVRNCAIALDNMGIEPCGHKAVEKGILLKVYTSCEPHQRAADPSFSIAGICIRPNGKMGFDNKKKLSETQTTWAVDFTRATCFVKAEDPCQLHTLPTGWTWQDFATGEYAKHVQLKRREESGQPTWYYVLVHKGKLELFKQHETEDVTKYGHKLFSGSEREPPDEIKEAVARVLNFFV